jgi:LPXTG-motif cell wall-anchored protein
MVLASTMVACLATPEEEVGGDRASVTQAAFNKNTVLTDKELRDSSALSVADIQAFLDKTPWGTRSVLATYEENGKTAAEIMHETATKYGINPLELLTRVQMEQGLISKETASDERISIAFGCGCPHSPVCSSKYEGFANQADCAAGTLSRSMDRALTSNGTATGWKAGEEKLTEDEVEVTPTNSATAALYTYTPWVGEAGGGRKGIGGASLHYQVWNRFADAVGYGSVASADTPQQAPGQVLEAGTPADEPNNGGKDESQGGDASADAGSVSADAGSPPADAGSADASPNDDSTEGDGAGTDSSDSTEGEDDDDILSEGNAPPATNAPPPSSSKSKSKSKSSRGDDDLPEATEEELAGKKRTTTSGCSSTGSSGSSDASLVGLALVGALVVAKRRRSA